MSDEKIKVLSEKQRAKSGNPIRDAIKRAKQHVRNVGAEGLDEPESFTSGDMKRFIESPDEYEEGDEDERGEKE